MPESPSINIGEKAYWTLKQTLAWIAWRDADRVNTVYREWRDRYYEPQLSDWRSKPPLIWDWRSPADELDGAAQALRQKCEAGALHGAGREGVGGPRREIASLQWPDLMLIDIAGMTAGPQLYDSSADPLAIMSGRVEPAFHDVLFVAADVVKAFPAPGEAEKNPGEVKKASLSTMVAFCRSLKGVKRNRKEMDQALRAEFGHLPPTTCAEICAKAGFKAPRGRRPKPK
jgi:hypothetical protein